MKKFISIKIIKDVFSGSSSGVYSDFVCFDGVSYLSVFPWIGNGKYKLYDIHDATIVDSESEVDNNK